MKLILLPKTERGISEGLIDSDYLNRYGHENSYCPKCKSLYSVSYNPPVMRPAHWYCVECNTRFILNGENGELEEWK